MWRTRLLAIAGGAASALFHLAAVSGSAGAITIMLLAQLPLFLVGLTLGTASVMLAGGTATLAVGAAVGGDPAVAYALRTALPAIAVVWLALIWRTSPDGGTEWYPPGRIIAWLCAAGLVFVAYAVAAGPPRAFGPEAQEAMTQALRNMGVAAPDAGVARAMELLRHYYPAIAALTVVTLVMVNAAFAQWIAVQLGRNIRPTPAYSALELPRWAEIAILVSAALSFLPDRAGQFGQNALILLAGPFFFAGLAVIHTITVGWPGRRAVLVVLYILVFGLGWPAVLVAGLGVFEPFLGLRRRFSGQGRNQEEE